MNVIKDTLLYLPRAFVKGLFVFLRNIINLEHMVVLDVQRTLNNPLLIWISLRLIFVSIVILIGCLIIVLIYQVPFLFLCISVIIFVYIGYQDISRTFTQEIKHIEQIRNNICKHAMPDRLLYLKGYLEQILLLSKFPLQIRKRSVASSYYQWYDEGLERKKFQAYYKEAYNYLMKLDTHLLENQEYFLLFTEIQDLLNDNTYTFELGSSNRLKDIQEEHIVGLLKSISLKRGHLYFITLFLVISSYVFINLIGSSYSPSVFNYIFIPLFLFLSIFGIFLLFGFVNFCKNRILKRNEKICMIFGKLRRTILFFTNNVKQIELLILSEQGVVGIESVMVDKIAYHIGIVVKLYCQYSKCIDDLEKITKLRMHLFSPKFPYEKIQDIIVSEKERGKQDMEKFQSILKSWMTTHMKDLQSYQQEIHQMHQSLSQNKNENAEVIDLLEKNFNLHLQSMQKVQNSI